MLQKIFVLWMAGVVGFNATGEAIDPGTPCQLPEPPMIHNVYAGDFQNCQVDLAHLADNHVIKFWEGPDLSDVIPIINFYKQQELFLTLHFPEIRHIDC